MCGGGQLVHHHEMSRDEFDAIVATMSVDPWPVGGCRCFIVMGSWSLFIDSPHGLAFAADLCTGEVVQLTTVVALASFCWALVFCVQRRTVYAGEALVVSGLIAGFLLYRPGLLIFLTCRLSVENSSWLTRSQLLRLSSKS